MSLVKKIIQKLEDDATDLKGHIATLQARADRTKAVADQLREMYADELKAEEAKALKQRTTRSTRRL